MGFQGTRVGVQYLDCSSYSSISSRSDSGYIPQYFFPWLVCVVTVMLLLATKIDINRRPWIFWITAISSGVMTAFSIFLSESRPNAVIQGKIKAISKVHRSK